MATTPPFKYQPMFEKGKDTTEYYLKIEKEGLTAMANAAFRDVSFMLRRSHNEQVAKILSDPEASDNDKYVALTFLRNAEVAAKGLLPFCQDTGTAIIHGEKGQQVWTGYCDEEALSLGVYKTYTEENLRYSQNAPLTMYEEVNTKCNLPAQIDIEAGDESHPEPRDAGSVPRREDEDAGYGGLSSLPHCLRHRRYVGREEPADREARFYPLL